MEVIQPNINNNEFEIGIADESAMEAIAPYIPILAASISNFSLIVWYIPRHVKIRSITR